MRTFMYTYTDLDKESAWKKAFENLMVYASTSKKNWQSKRVHLLSF